MESNVWKLIFPRNLICKLSLTSNVKQWDYSQRRPIQLLLINEKVDCLVSQVPSHRSSKHYIQTMGWKEFLEKLFSFESVTFLKTAFPQKIPGDYSIVSRSTFSSVYLKIFCRTGNFHKHDIPQSDLSINKFSETLFWCTLTNLYLWFYHYVFDGIVRKLRYSHNPRITNIPVMW